MTKEKHLEYANTMYPRLVVEGVPFMGIHINKKGMKLISLCVTVACVMTACGTQTADESLVIVDREENTISYEFITAERGDVELTQKIRCTYKQQKEQEVSFALTGRIVDKLYVQEGDKVTKGQVVAELAMGTLKRDIEDLQYRIAKNELAIEQAKENETLDIQDAWVGYANSSWQTEEAKKATEESIEKIKQNYRYILEDAEDTLALDRKQLQMLQQEQRNCRIYSTIDGLVYKTKENVVGSTSKAGETIMTIVDNSECLFEAEDTQYADCFKSGESVEMIVSAGSAAGTYELMPYNIENWDGVLQFSVFDGPLTSGIEVGTGGTIQFAMDKRENVLCIPSNALSVADDKYYVYVVDEEGLRQVRWVEVGLQGDYSVEIISGLQEGEKVVRK